MSKEDEITIIGFIKIGQEQHIKQLYESGLLFLNTFEFHRYSKHNKNRDTVEGASSYFHDTTFSIVSEDKTSITKVAQGTSNGYEKENLKNHIYSLFTLDATSKNEELISSEMLGFGDTAIIIYDTEEFLKRLEKALQKLPYNSKAKFVNYYNPQETYPSLSPFDKRKRYIYENEFRILVMGHPDPTLPIEIGSIKDISVILESKDLLKLSLESPKEEL